MLLRTADGRFDLTPLGACLRADHPDGLAAFARYQGDAIIQRPWANLLHSVRTGETAFDAVFGASLFEYLADHPDAAALFTAGMAARTAEHWQAIVAAYDWSGFNAIVDVGGADGTLLSSILATAANARGVIFDQPRVQAAAEQRIAADGLQRSLRLRGRRLFGGGAARRRCLPAQVYPARLGRHGGRDDPAQCAPRGAAHARLLVIEPLLPDGDEPAQETAMMDVAMLAITGGRERTAAEFAALYERAGFRLSRTIPLPAQAVLAVGMRVAVTRHAVLSRESLGLQAASHCAIRSA